jgi:hypothetical protein
MRTVFDADTGAMADCCRCDGSSEMPLCLVTNCCAVVLLLLLLLLLLLRQFAMAASKMALHL